MNHLKLAGALAAGLALIAAGTNARAGGNLDTFAFTFEPAGDFGLPGEVASVVPIFWDERCASVSYTLNTVEPNAFLPAPNIDLETTREEIQTSLDRWNDIRTSYIEFNIDDIRTVDADNVRGFDFVNEITFQTDPSFGALASSPSTSLQQDADLPAGLDLDGDGDSDFFDPDVEGINVCTDIDGDGDIEFPAGFYRAGTILDNDVQFSPFTTWEIEPTVNGGADIQAVATHEWGHSHGLSHSLINLISDNDGTSSTMFPFIQTTDPEAEAGTRTLHEDDIAWSSFSYPEGGDGPLSSLQPGDIPFHKAYGVIEGEVTRGDGQPIAGSNVYVRSKVRGEIPVGAFSGEATAFFLPPGVFPPIPGGGFFFRENEADAVVNGNYSLPVPLGLYQVFNQSPDVGGADASNVSLTANTGEAFGQHGFDEEGLSFRSRRETASELRPGFADFRFVIPGFPIRRADFVTNESISLESFGDIDFGGFGVEVGASAVKYATRFSGEEVLAALQEGATPTTALFQFTAFDSSIVARIDRVSLALGSLSEDGLVASIDRALTRKSDFVAQDGDLSPFFFRAPKAVARRLERKLERNPDQDVFVVIEMPDNPDLGPSGTPPLLALDVDLPPGNSFLSLDGGPFEQIPFNWAVQLNLVP